MEINITEDQIRQYNLTCHLKMGDRCKTREFDSVIVLHKFNHDEHCRAMEWKDPYLVNGITVVVLKGSSAGAMRTCGRKELEFIESLNYED